MPPVATMVAGALLDKKLYCGTGPHIPRVNLFLNEVYEVCQVLPASFA